MIQRIEPMLAVAAKPFDSQDHLYEVKWDGVRCLAAAEHGAVRLWGRELADYTERYPELDALRKLPPALLVGSTPSWRTNVQSQARCSYNSSGGRQPPGAASGPMAE